MCETQPAAKTQNAECDRQSERPGEGAESRKRTSMRQIEGKN